MSTALKRQSAAPKRSLANDLLPLTTQWGMRHLEATVAGDPDAAVSLIGAADNNNRGKIVAALWRHRAPPEVLRAALEAAYEHDHNHVINALGHRRLVAALRAAQFPTGHLPDEVTIWRGGSGGLDLFLSGLSWTMDRDCACWFAMRFADIYPPPRVVRATVRRAQVLAHLTGRGEDEILVAPFSVKGETDGDIEEWREVARQVNQRRAARGR